MILIVGGSSLLGQAVARQLLTEGQAVRLLVRTPSKVNALAQLGADVVKGDLTDAGSLARACVGVERVLATVHALLGRGRNTTEAVDDIGHRDLIDAAKAASVAHFVYISILGVTAQHPIDFFRIKHKTETYLKNSGLSYTILRPAAFMESHAHELNGQSILENGKTRLLGHGTKLRNFVAVADVAHFTILALTDPVLRNRMLEVGGPENFTNNQVANLYGKHADVTPKISHLPPTVAKLLSIVFKPLHPGLSRVMHLGSLPDDAFSESFDAAALSAEFDIQLTTLEAFIRDRVAESVSTP